MPTETTVCIEKVLDQQMFVFDFGVRGIFLTSLLPCLLPWLLLGSINHGHRYLTEPFLGLSCAPDGTFFLDSSWVMLEILDARIAVHGLNLMHRDAPRQNDGHVRTTLKGTSFSVI